MSLKKLLTGQPGNIKEFAEMAKPVEQKVNVLVDVWNIMAPYGSIIIKGEVKYSCSNRKGKYLKYSSRKRNLGGILSGYWTGERMIDALLDQERPNFNYLRQQGWNLNIKYNDDTLRY